MKLKLFTFISLFIFVPTVYAQSVVIKPKKVVYRRTKPLTEYKRTFEITYPKVSGVSPALARKIEHAISYEKNTNLNVREEMREIQWLEEADFTVNYNKNGILDINLFITGTGAYSSSVNTPVVVNLKTGQKIRPQDIFVNLAALAAEVKKAQQAEMRAAEKEYKTDPSMEDFDAGEYFQKADFKVADLKEFTISDSGVAFIYDYGFPHVVQALQPDGKYFFAWARLKPFIRRDGLLARFTR